MTKVSLNAIRLLAARRVRAFGLAGILLSGAVAIPLVASVGAQATNTEALEPASFTEEQVNRGSSIAVSDCSSCHGSRLVGGGGPEGGPALLGQRFADKWFVGSIMPLFAYVINAMPADNAGSLEPDDAAAVVAYILSRNDLVPGDQELPNNLEALALMGFNQSTP